MCEKRDYYYPLLLCNISWVAPLPEPTGRGRPQRWTALSDRWRDRHRPIGLYVADLPAPAKLTQNDVHRDAHLSVEPARPCHALDAGVIDEEPGLPLFPH